MKRVRPAESNTATQHPNKRTKTNAGASKTKNATVAQDWYLTPPDDRNADEMDVDEGYESLASPQPNKKVKVPKFSKPKGKQKAVSPQPERAGPSAEMSKNQRKRAKKKQAKEAAKAAAAQEDEDDEPAPPPIIPKQKASSTVSSNALTRVAQNPPTTPVQPPQGIQPPPSYTTLESMPKGTWAAFSVIAVVVEAKPIAQAKQGGGDLSLNFTIVDPSLAAGKGIDVNCFTPTYREWLPAVKPGVVVVLRNLKCGAGVVGYKDHLQWAVYDSGDPTRRHGERGTAPSSGTVRGFGGSSVHHTPFYDMSEEDIAYSLRLHDWWGEKQAKQAERDKNTIVVQCPSVLSKTHRYHGNPAHLPLGKQYFDWTVQILYVETGANLKENAVFVTDYDEIPKARNISESWVPHGASGTVFRIQFQQDARLVAPHLVVGNFYRINNLRSDWFYDGLQATLRESKCSPLDTNDADVIKILERKAALALPTPSSSGLGRPSPLSPASVKTVQQIRVTPSGSNVLYDDDFVFQLLHIDAPDIYVTDYTSHDLLRPIHGKLWANGLDKHVLKITLHDGQREMSPTLSVGEIYVVRNLRVACGTFMYGKLGGKRKTSMERIGENDTNYGAARAEAIERKKRLTGPVSVAPISAAATKPERPSAVVPVAAPSRAVPAPPRPSPRELAPNHETIQQVEAHPDSVECPFFLQARVVDYFPFRLGDTFRRFCRKCEHELKDAQDNCHQCRKPSKIISTLRLAVQDREGRRLRLSVTGTNTPFLANQPHVILRHDPEAMEQFSKYLKPLLGNLEEVHENLLNNVETDPSGEELSLMVDRWKDADGNWVYGLCDYTLLNE
ncbi:Telo-bind domain-containing protein [Mycena kentingensis (nom. inval.)]|nr:Telo-bind domain-containing protein [Mycena kentingensis (nom. inval.)]